MSGIRDAFEALRRQGHISDQRLDELAAAVDPTAIAGANELVHLESCGSCRGLIVGFQRTNAVLQGPWIERSATVTAAASAGVRVTRARGSRGSTGSVFGGSRTGRAAVAATAAIVVVAAVGLVGVRAIAPAAATQSPTLSASTSSTASSTSTPSPAPTAISTATPAATPTVAVPSSQPGAFTATGSLLEAQMWPTATRLQDGRVLVTGGQIDTGTDIGGTNSNRTQTPVAPEIYVPATGKFGKTGPMVHPRFASTATLLDDGRVLVVGGDAKGEKILAAELYDPKTGTFSETGSTAVVHAGHTATLLTDGRVLVAGGLTGGQSGPTAEIYDPQTGRFSVTGQMVQTRESQAATLLKDGRVLLVGGYAPTTGDNAPEAKTSAEIYDPSSGKFSSTGSMAFAPGLPDATFMPDGRVLVTGDTEGYTSELYDPKTGKFKPAGSVGTAGSMNVVLPDGLVLLAGGYGGSHRPSTTALLYNPGTGAVTPTGSMGTPRACSAAALLDDGRVLVVGGLSSQPGKSQITNAAEIYTQPHPDPEATAAP